MRTEAVLHQCDIDRTKTAHLAEDSKDYDERFQIAIFMIEMQLAGRNKWLLDQIEQRLESDDEASTAIESEAEQNDRCCLRHSRGPIGVDKPSESKKFLG